MIEQVGLKGHRIGSAVVSPVHANFIVNQGGATYNNVMDLIVLIKEMVYQEHGVELDLEVEIWRCKS